jgi:acetolactate synthase-1/2/3 large subunit
VALARAYGAHGEMVEETAGFAPAFERARKATEASRMPALIEVRIDPQAITTSTTLDAIRARALKG